MTDDLAFRPASLPTPRFFAEWDTRPHVRAAVREDGRTGFDLDWEQELAPCDWQGYWLAVLDGRPIGALSLQNPSGDPGLYYGPVPSDLRALDIFIGEPDCLGRGYGTRMMRWALERCFAEPSVAAVLVDPLAVNLRAHRFYERLGFRFVEQRRFGEDDCRLYRLDRTDWRP